MAKRAVFIDRDDTLIADVGYCKDPNSVRLLPGVAEGLKRLDNAGYSLIVVTNQSGIGRGYFTEKELEAVHSRLKNDLLRHGIKLGGIYFCPHKPEDACACRKPRPGLLLRAALEMDLDLRSSFMIGDRELDILTGKAVGAQTLLISNIDLTEDERMRCSADFIVKDLPEAAGLILNDSKSE